MHYRLFRQSTNKIVLLATIRLRLDDKLSFTYDVYQFDSSQNCLRSPKRFESQQQSCTAFDVTVLLLDKVVLVLALPDSPAKEAQCGDCIPFGGQQEVDGLS